MARLKFFFHAWRSAAPRSPVPSLTDCRERPCSRLSQCGRPEANPATGKKDVVWFALNDDRPLFAFGGLWTEFKGDRGIKSKPIPGPHLVYGFLIIAPNAIVEPIHPKPCR